MLPRLRGVNGVIKFAEKVVRDKCRGAIVS